ncbi:ATP-binding protein [candidate division WOR-3 bacterium]|nr:ATP-binding protein [candidate division WOR-3 bacterium]
MKQIVIISGKGGTGKTVIAASFAALAEKKVMADCDVDAADLHLLLHPDVKETHQFMGSKKAIINQEKCTQCGKCINVCRFDAISEVRGRKREMLKQVQHDIVEIDTISCEGCGVCKYICPENAITMRENISGEWYISDTKYGALVHAKLGIAEENSGRLVTLVRQNAISVTESASSGMDYIIIDGPPGIGCPVIASLSGADLALIVTEPSLSGIHDMERIIKVTNHFGVKTVVCINKYDLNLKNTKFIEEYCQKSNINLIGKIPFDKIVIEALVNGVPVVEYSENAASKIIKIMWNNIKALCNHR